MGITTEEFFENIYSVIFSPKEFFERRNIVFSVRLALFVIIVMAIINKLAFSIADKTIINHSFLFSLCGGVIYSIIAWMLVALFFEYTAKIFNTGGNFSKFLYLSAFAVIPSIFFAPLSLLKQLGEIGYILSVVFGCFLYIWIVVLYIFALKNSYNTTWARAIMFIFLPLISSIPAIYQIVGFYKNIWYIFSI